MAQLLRIRYFALVCAIALPLGGCTSTNYVAHNSCAVASQSSACYSKCTGFTDSDRPLWCYRMFCVNGSPIYGAWCDGSQNLKFPTPNEVNAVKSNIGYKYLVGTDVITGQTPNPHPEYVNDNGLAFVMALANRSDVPQQTVHMAFIGESIGSGFTSAVPTERYNYVTDLSQALSVSAQIDTTTANGTDKWWSDTLNNALTPHLNDYMNIYYSFITTTVNQQSYAFSMQEQSYSLRGGTGFVSRLTGYKQSLGGEIYGIASAKADLKTYNAFDGVVFNPAFLPSDSTSVGQQFLIGQEESPWATFTQTGGANYRFLQDKIVAGIENFLPGYNSGSGPGTPDPTKAGVTVLALGFEGYRDGRMLANGFDIMRSVKSTVDSNTDANLGGLFGAFGEGNVSYNLLDSTATLQASGGFATLPVLTTATTAQDHFTANETSIQNLTAAGIQLNRTDPALPNYVLQPPNLSQPVSTYYKDLLFSSYKPVFDYFANGANSDAVLGHTTDYSNGYSSASRGPANNYYSTVIVPALAQNPAITVGQVEQMFLTWAGTQTIPPTYVPGSDDYKGYYDGLRFGLNYSYTANESIYGYIAHFAPSRMTAVESSGPTDTASLQGQEITQAITNQLEMYKLTVGRHRLTNQSFASGLQMLYSVNDKTFYYHAPVTDKKNAGNNAFTLYDINKVAQRLGEGLGEYQNNIMVMSAGTSSVNNTGNGGSLFYGKGFLLDNNNSTPDKWDDKRVWYQSSNIYQTNGSTESILWNLVDGIVNGAPVNPFYVPNYSFGNTPVESTLVTDDANNIFSSEYQYFVANQSIANTPNPQDIRAGSLVDMRYTSNYPAAFLNNLWVNDYYTFLTNPAKGPGGGDDPAMWNIYRMDPLLTWSNWNHLQDSSNTTTPLPGAEESANKLTYNRVGISGAPGTPDDQQVKVNAQFMLGKGTGLEYGSDVTAKPYQQSEAYRYLIAGAFDSTANDGKGSLVSYTNAAGTLKYNYLTVNANPYQTSASEAGQGNSFVEWNGASSGATNPGNTQTLQNGFYVPYIAPVQTTSGPSLEIKGEYFTSPSQMAQATLMGYVQRLASLYPQVNGNDLAFVMRQTADQVYGSNFNTTIDNISTPITQASFYFTNSIKDDIDIANPTDEQNSLTRLNQQSGRDVFVFTGVNQSQEYDSMYNQMFTDSGANGIATLTSGMLKPELFGEGHVSLNTSFFLGNGVWKYNGCGGSGVGSCLTGETADPDYDPTQPDHSVYAKVGDQTYILYRSAFQQVANAVLGIDANGQSVSGAMDGAPSDPTLIQQVLDRLNNAPTANAGNGNHPGNSSWPGIKNIDPNTVIGGSGSGVANSFLTIDLGSQANVKFNWESKPEVYYDMRFLGCDGAVTCTQSAYQTALNQYYNAKNTPEDQRDLIDLNIDSNGGVTACTSGRGCSYKYHDGGYDQIGLSHFNESRNVLMLAVEDAQGQYDYSGKRVKIEVLVLDPAIVAHTGGGYNVNTQDQTTSPSGGGTLNGELQYFVELNKVIDGTGSGMSQQNWNNKLQSLGIADIKDARISDSCLSDLNCSHHDLLTMFKLRPDMFDRAPSNVYGYGNVDMETAYRELHYQGEYFYKGVTGTLSRDLQQFFYTQNCQQGGNNCGVQLSAELGFAYKPYEPGAHVAGQQNEPAGALPDPSDPTGATPDANATGRIRSDHAVHIKTPYGDKYIDVSDVAGAVNYVNGYSGLNIGYVMGAIGPSVGFNDSKMIKSTFGNVGGQLTLNAFASNGSLMVGNERVNANEFSRYNITNADRNTDQFGYAIIGGITSSSLAALYGMRYNQSISEFGEMKIMFFGNKNEHDLINNNKVGLLTNGSSLYALTGSQQGMFTNPYYRFAGGYSGSIYSFVGNIGANWQYRFSTAQSFNPMQDVMGIGGGNLAMATSPLTSSSGNSLQEMQVMYNANDGSSYSLSYGMLNEEHGMLGSNLTTGNTSTYYFDAKLVQHLGKGFYLMGHYNVGLVNPSSAYVAAFQGFDGVIAQKFSLGIAKENIFGGTMFLTYTEPNRVISGSVNLIDSDGLAGSVDLTRTLVERNFEVGYSFGFKGYNFSISGMLRTNPYGLKSVENDGMVMLRISGGM